MPPAPVVFFTAEIVMKGAAAAAGGSSVPINNVYHFQRRSSANPLSAVNVEAAFDAAIAAPVLAFLNARYGQTTTDVRFLESTSSPVTTVARTGVGAIPNDSMASECVAYLNVRTQYRGKSYKGNKKYGPLSETDSTTTSDVLNAGAITRLGAIATALLAGFTDSDGNVWDYGILSRSFSVLDANPVTIEWNKATLIQARHSIGGMDKRKIKSVY